MAFGGELSGSGIAPEPTKVAGGGVDISEVEVDGEDDSDGSDGMGRGERTDLAMVGLAVRSQEEVARILGITQRQVAKIEARAFQKLRLNPELAEAFHAYRH